MFLPRIGPAVASRIVEFREQNGNFKQVADLMLVKGSARRRSDSSSPTRRLPARPPSKAKVKVEESEG